MVNVLSRIIAVILTVLIAIVLYPFCGLFWLMGILGRIGEKLFKFTNGTIQKMWSDISSE
jgi:hypothetical protein